MAPAESKLLLTDRAISSSNHVPSNYIRPVGDRPNLLDVESSTSIPLIDLHGLLGPARSDVIKEIGSACRTDGFFMVKNHGIPEEVVREMLRVAREFFHLPEAERLKCYSDDPSRTTRLSTSFNVRTEKVSNWRDFLRLHCYPLEDFIREWPCNPPDFKQVVGEYSKHARALAVRLLEGISESLGLERDHMVKAMGKQAQHMAINYYPPCPQPELTYGLPGHKDPNAITVLLPDSVSGLQVLRSQKWVAVEPVPNALIINMGDQIQASNMDMNSLHQTFVPFCNESNTNKAFLSVFPQVLSNDRYKSVLHRVIVNNKSERISVPTFYCPSPDAVIEPAEALVDDDHPLGYRSFTYGEYYEKISNEKEVMP
ncbi:Naringenin,2-oxoglutarate 3-dioxygenase [Ananas comosus]|uniref:Naringenin,2-oxoglutarate 3-dioxygenase n=1 Tax=Ananas comosus TaxID=4615 RepID=A0A199V5H4_ANACO|nr:Naringenin,2-oxoglutarate 3-dioxygenase [Ananas comosus]